MTRWLRLNATWGALLFLTGAGGNAGEWRSKRGEVGRRHSFGVILAAAFYGAQQPPVAFSFRALALSFFSSGTSTKQAARQSKSLR